MLACFDFIKIITKNLNERTNEPSVELVKKIDNQKVTVRSKLQNYKKFQRAHYFSCFLHINDSSAISSAS